MRRRRWARGAGATTALLVLLAAPGIRAQTAHPHDVPHDPPPGAHRFLEAARAAAEPFHDPRVARAAGYRPLGPDFPGMGRHWINMALITGEVVDPARPPVLCYAELDGRTALVALAFTLALGPGEEPPEHPAGRAAWHDHSATLDEESLLLVSPATHEQNDDAMRLAMIHAWLWVENPDGAFAQHNWALPFRRLGLATPEGVSAATGRALSLSGEGRDYYEALFRKAAAADEQDSEAIRRHVEAHAARVDDWVGRAAAASGAAPPDVEELEAIWTSLVYALERDLSPEARERMRAIGMR